MQAWPVDIRHSEFQTESPAQRRAVCAAGNLQVPVTLQGNTGNRLSRLGEMRAARSGAVIPLLISGAAGLDRTEKHPRQWLVQVGRDTEHL